MLTFDFINYEGNKYQLRFRQPHKKYEADGICNPPLHNKVSTLYVDPKLPKNRKIEVLVHELTHAFFWDVTEEKVQLFAECIQEALDRINY